MNAIIALAIVGPLAASGVGLLVRERHHLRDAITLMGLSATALAAIALLIDVQRNGTTVVRVGGWDPELGIVLVADQFAALILVVATLTILVVDIFAIGQRGTASTGDQTVVGPMLLVLTAGVSLAILTGDLFTLFVAFELILVSSYVLLTHQGRAAQLRSGMTYVVINLLASTLFLLGLAYVYTATRTVNIALLAERIPELDNGVRLGIGLWFLVVFGTKAAMFPLFSWLPDSYPTAPTTVTAVFAGLLTKIGVYVMIRFHTLTGMLSFHVVSQIGYMLMGLGLFSVAGVAGAVLFLVHQIPVKTVMFLVGGLIEDDQGNSSLDKVGGLAARRPIIAVLFAIPALSLAGIPPFSGFVAKLSLIDAGINAGSVAIVVVALVASMFTLLSMSKIWLGVFWREPTPPSEPASSKASKRMMNGATMAAVAGTLAVVALAGPLWNMSEEIARDLLDGQTYINEVLGTDRGGVASP